MVEENRGLSHSLESNEGREAVDAKLAAYAAIVRINEGFTNIIAGMEALKIARLILEKLSPEKIDERIQEAREQQALLNRFLLIPLCEIEQSEALYFSRLGEKRQKV
jgi:hypothetical protein